MSDNKNIPSYYANIPAPVRYDKTLPANAKLLYGEITALTSLKGYCWSSNSYFADLYGVHEKTISLWISKLKKSGHIIAEIGMNYKRKIFITPRNNAVPPPQKADSPHVKRRSPPPQKADSINTMSTTSNNTMTKKNPAKRRSPSPADKNQKYRPLAELLYKLDEETASYVPGSRNVEKTIDTWADSIRLLFENDKKKALTFEIVEGVIRWCKDPDNFPGEFSWVPNIRSGKKLREKFPVLLSQYQRSLKEHREKQEEAERQRAHKEYLRNLI